MALKLLMVPAALIDFSVFCRFEQVFVADLKVIGDTICISEKLQKQNKLLAVSSQQPADAMLYWNETETAF